MLLESNTVYTGMSSVHVYGHSYIIIYETHELKLNGWRGIQKKSKKKRTKTQMTTKAEDVE